MFPQRNRSRSRPRQRSRSRQRARPMYTGVPSWRSEAVHSGFVNTNNNTYIVTNNDGYFASDEVSEYDSRQRLVEVMSIEEVQSTKEVANEELAVDNVQTKNNNKANKSIMVEEVINQEFLDNNNNSNNNNSNNNNSNNNKNINNKPVSVDRTPRACAVIPFNYEKKVTAPAVMNAITRSATRSLQEPTPVTRQLVPSMSLSAELKPLQPSPAPVAKTADVDQSPFVTAARQLKFCCQLAHGSPTVMISNFSSVPELFDTIAKGFDISRDDVIFCTINTFKPDMDHLFAGSLELSDMLFVHVRGQPVEVEMQKTEESLGVTIADNGLCRSFIKRIRPGSVAEKAKPGLAVGQMIEKIDGVDVLGLRHYEVARILRLMPLGKTFTLRLVCPTESAFSFMQPRSQAKAKPSLGNGTQTLRFKSDGGVVVEEQVANTDLLKKLNEVFDMYLGVQDDQLAQTIWEKASQCDTLLALNDAIRESELAMFEFPDELVFDMWGIMSDWKRAQKKEHEQTSPRGMAVDETRLIN